ncbi:MAG: hypothetical protein F6K25_24335 [Okeania sp. SIO2G4]|uniref:hypothetical protein n=1 Tax=unclassified Okeania TaxID=2634635 RepID=UPI0013BCA72B|nr:MULTISPECIES: hypothetical protein [unclassified Okeania]NEP95911.1 hypothetical protein [Okeania sp. SIO2F5]NEQ93619.1 hypothetical protein [Okeania sp. SIO2G4]
MTNYENFSSLGRLDMARGPRHPTLREATKIDRFYPLKRGCFQQQFFGKEKKKEEGRRL